MDDLWLVVGGGILATKYFDFAYPWQLSFHSHHSPVFIMRLQFQSRTSQLMVEQPIDSSEQLPRIIGLSRPDHGAHRFLVNFTGFPSSPHGKRRPSLLQYHFVRRLQSTIMEDLGCVTSSCS